MRLYLASTSPARLALLRAAGIEPVLLNPAVDEDAVAAAAGPLPVAEAVQVLARAKAEAVVGTLVVGSPIVGMIVGGDSLFELAGSVFGKPHRPEVAVQR
ncbi:MAG: Maf family protein, partial [Rhodoglobus sp.]|nr:Maf family protein [Rhodoglobus sp.]